MNAATCQAAYRELFENHLNNDTLHDIDKSLNHELVLGRLYFKDKIEEITNKQVRIGVPGRPMIEEEGATYVVY